MRQASTPVRSLHKMGLGINLGGTIFGLVALNPSVARISDRSERGRVLNEAWTRFQTIGTLAMGVTVATWRLGGLKEAEGATPVESGAEPAPETPEEAARSQRLSAFLGAATVVLVASVLGLSSALEVRAVQKMEKSRGALSRLFS
jgi:hypothetical protein